MCFHCGLDDPKRAAKLTLPLGTPATGKDSDATVPLPPDDPNRGEEFAERVQALEARQLQVLVWNGNPARVASAPPRDCFRYS